MTISPEEIRKLFQTINSQFNKCLEPRMTCKNKAVRAHSVQNGRVIDLIAKDGHVIMLRPSFSNEKMDIEFKSVGRNRASTFTGLCNEHDTAIFKPIDTRPFDRENNEHLFLLAYRSVCRELHAIMEAAVKNQSVYRSRVERGVDAADATSAAGQMATERMIISYETYQYRFNNFDIPLVNGSFDNIEHDIIEIFHPAPMLAVSSLFSFDELRNVDGVVRVVLNVFPISNSISLAVFSYASTDRNMARAALDRILNSRDAYQKYELSRLILNRIENFMISPVHFDTWSAEKISRIKAAFTNTIANREQVPDHPDMMLF